MTDTTNKSKHRTVTAEQALVPTTPAPMSRGEIAQYAERMGKQALVTVAPVDPECADFVEISTPELFAQAVEEADYVAPKFIRIKPGQTMRAVLEAKGTMILERVDKSTGVVEEHEVKKYTVSIHGGKIRGWFLGSYELDQQLDLVPGDGTHEVRIFRGQQEEIDGGHRVNRWQATARRVKAAPSTPQPAQLEAAAS